MIRPATPVDAAAIGAIWNKAIQETTVTFNPDPKSDADIAALISATTCVVYVNAGQVMGFARSFPFRSGRGYQHTVELTVMLDARAQGQGAGRLLVETLCDIARRDNKHVMIAGCSAENPAAVAFHRRLGFEQLAILPQVGFKFDRWIDLVLLQKRL